MPDELLAEVDRLVALRHSSRSALVVEALGRFIEIERRERNYAAVWGHRAKRGPRPESETPGEGSGLWGPEDAVFTSPSGRGRESGEGRLFPGPGD